MPAELVSRVAAAVYGDETKVVTTARADAARAKPGKPPKTPKAPKSKTAEPDDDGSTKAAANGQVKDAGKNPGKGDGSPMSSGTSVVRTGGGTALKPRR